MCVVYLHLDASPPIERSSRIEYLSYVLLSFPTPPHTDFFFQTCFSHFIITARKHSLRRLCFYMCLSVHRGGGIPTCLAGLQAHTQGGVEGFGQGVLQAHTWGDVSQHALRQAPQQTAVSVGGMHPTGLHSCLYNEFLYFIQKFTTNSFDLKKHKYPRPKLSGYHADTPITIKAKANPQGQQLLSLIFMSTLYNAL